MTVTLTWRHVLAIQVGVALALTAPAALPLPAEAEEHEEEEQWEDEEFDVGAPDEVDPTPDEHGICPTSVQGYLAPTQAVWQDDYHFPDQVGKQITWDNQAKVGNAELPMVKDKPTVIAGVHRYASRPPGLVASRGFVVLHGISWGTEPVPARVRFYAEGVDTDPKLNYVGLRADLRFGEPCREPMGFMVSVPAPNGLPPDQAFRFTGTGRYTLVADLESPEGRSYGAARVQGDVVEPVSPAVSFMPLTINPVGEEERERLIAAAAQAAEVADRNLPDYWPLKPGGFDGAALGFLDRSAFLALLTGEWLDFHREAWPDVEPAAEEAVLAALGHALEQGRRLGDGRKVVAIMPDDEFHDLYDSPGYFGAAFSQHAVVIRQRWAGWHWLIAHELAHTMPYLWSEEDMPRDCNVDRHWHNERALIAYGFRVTFEGKSNRRLFRETVPYMGPPLMAAWTDQCTYWHLLGQMTAGDGGGAVEPQAAGARLVVQGRFARDGDVVAGDLLPGYTTMAAEELPRLGPDADHALVLLGAEDAELARYALAPEFRLAHAGPDDHDVERSLAYFGYALPRPAGLARIELTGPAGLLDALTVSPNSPTARVLEPGDGAAVLTPDGAVTIRWTGSDPDGDALVYTLLHSADRGHTWQPVVLDADAQSARLSLAPGEGHRVRLIASDGANSDQDEVGFTVVGTACPPGEVSAAGFTDTAGNTHEAAIDCVAWHGIARGTTTTTYSPTLPVRRDQMASFLARLVDRAGASLPSGGGAGFTDIAGNTHEAAIRGLAVAGIVQGTTPTTYAPDVVVRRDQMASFLVRVYEYIAAEQLARAPSGFADVGGNTHEASIDKAAAAGFARGTTTTTYSPAAAVRRDQMASFLTRVLDRLATDGRLVPG